MGKVKPLIPIAKHLVGVAVVDIAKAVLLVTKCLLAMLLGIFDVELSLVGFIEVGKKERV